MNEKSFKERFNVYLEKLQKDEQRKERALKKTVKICESAVTQAVGNVTYVNYEDRKPELQSLGNRPMLNQSSIQNMRLN